MICICKCGHLLDEHMWVNKDCDQCRICPCMKFKADNLKYLELMSDKRS